MSPENINPDKALKKILKPKSGRALKKILKPKPGRALKKVLKPKKKETVRKQEERKMGLPDKKL